METKHMIEVLKERGLSVYPTGLPFKSGVKHEVHNKKQISKSQLLANISKFNYNAGMNKKDKSIILRALDFVKTHSYSRGVSDILHKDIDAIITKLLDTDEKK